MSTITFIQHCRYAINQIDHLMTFSFKDEDGYVDYSDQDQHETHCTELVERMMKTCSNPSLPTYQKMIDKAVEAQLITASDAFQYFPSLIREVPSLSVG